MNKVDRFGFIASVLGFIVDTISLSMLFFKSEDYSSTPIYIWLLLLVSMFYSVCLGNFFIRKFFHEKIRKGSSDLSWRDYNNIEKVSFRLTVLIYMPIQIIYSIAAFMQINKLNPSLLLQYSGQFPERAYKAFRACSSETELFFQS